MEISPPSWEGGGVVSQGFEKQKMSDWRDCDQYAGRPRCGGARILFLRPFCLDY